MYRVKIAKSFKREYKRISRSNHRALIELEKVVALLIRQYPLDAKCRLHQLHGKYQSCAECHLLPDVLLIFRVIKHEKVIHLLRIGSHSELFD